MTVSVCIPAYNYAHFLPDAIESVLAQTYSDYELLIIDNCSTDNTPEVVRRYAERDPRIIYFRNGSNLGLVGNLNRCLESARHEYVKILCADDLLAPDCLKKSVAVLENHPNVVLVAHARHLVNDRLKTLAVRGYCRKFKILSGKEVIRTCLLEGNIIGEPSVAMFRNIADLPVFSTKYNQLMDLEYWFALLEKGDFAYLPEPLASFRQHEGQESISNIASFSFLDDEKKLLQRYQHSDSYLTLTVWETFRWRLRIAYDVWGQRKRAQNKMLIYEKIAEFIPCKYFYLVLPWKLLYSKIKQMIAR